MGAFVYSRFALADLFIVATKTNQKQTIRTIGILLGLGLITCGVFVLKQIPQTVDVIVPAPFFR